MSQLETALNGEYKKPEGKINKINIIKYLAHSLLREKRTTKRKVGTQ